MELRKEPIMLELSKQLESLLTEDLPEDLYQRLFLLARDFRLRYNEEKRCYQAQEEKQ